MGLDISYHRNIQRIGDNDYENEDLDQFNLGENHKAFPKQADYLRRGLYRSEDCDGFGAGAYSSYNRWRDELAKMAGYKSAEDAWAEEDGGRDSGPFWELINFSDCEGHIGPITSAKLAKDFAEHEGGASVRSEWFRTYYSQFRKAFEVAAQDGVVIFH